MTQPARPNEGSSLLVHMMLRLILRSLGGIFA